MSEVRSFEKHGYGIKYTGNDLYVNGSRYRFEFINNTLRVNGRFYIQFRCQGIRTLRLAHVDVYHSIILAHALVIDGSDIVCCHFVLDTITGETGFCNETTDFMYVRVPISDNLYAKLRMLGI